jgi:hypothetical protein
VRSGCSVSRRSGRIRPSVCQGQRCRQGAYPFPKIVRLKRFDQGAAVHEREARVLEALERYGEESYELLRFAPTPGSPIARAIPPALLTRCLDHLAAAQAADGGWHDEHGLAQWRPYVTIQVLHGLRSHGREIGVLPRG